MRDSEAQFRELADTTPALMWMTDAEGDVTFVNQGWLRFTGGIETAGVTFAASAHPDDREKTVRLWNEAMSRREEFRCEYRLRHAASDGYRWVLELGTPRCSGGEFVGYVGHRHRHPRAAHDGGGAARVRGELPRAGRHRPGDDVDDRHGRPDHVREPGLAALHGHDLPGGDGRELGARRAPGRRRVRAGELGGGARRAAPVGGRVPAPAPLRRVPLDPRSRRAAVRGRALRRLRGHGDRHPRAQDDGVAPVSRSTSASTGSPRRSSAACCPSGCRRSRASRWPRATCPARAAPPSAGDWYDVLERPDGRVALVVGDVVGHGLRAAASMGQLRNAFRAYGMVEASPAEVVARINRLVMSGVEQVMATVLYLVLDRETGEVAFSAAGHPPPLVIAPDGPRFLEGGRSVPIGAADPAVFREATAILPPGSSLLLYTDGLVERRDTPLDERLEELADVGRHGRRRRAGRALRARDRSHAGRRRSGRRRGAPRRAAAAGGRHRDQPDAAGRARLARAAPAAAGALPARAPARPRSSSTRSRSRSARRPATRSSTRTGRATRPTRWTWRSTAASSRRSCATAAAGATSAASTAAAGSASSRT